jgi:hypothetical protein
MEDDRVRLDPELAPQRRTGMPAHVRTPRGRRGRDQREQQRQELRENVHAAILGPCRARRKAAGEDLLGEQPVAFRGRRCGSHAAERGSGRCRRDSRRAAQALPFARVAGDPRRVRPEAAGAARVVLSRRPSSRSRSRRPRGACHRASGAMGAGETSAAIPHRSHRCRRERACGERTLVRAFARGPHRSNSPARSSRQPRTDAVGGSGSP